MNGTTSPLVTAYLADLDRALAGADPADRLEIVDAVREHIDAAVAELGATPTQAQIAAVLRRLGTADDVAAAWAVGEPRPTAGAPSSSPWSAPGLARTPPASTWGQPTLTGPPLRPSAHGLQPVPADESRQGTSPWLTALLVVVGLAVLGPLVLALAGAVFLVPVRTVGGPAEGRLTPGWWLLAVLVVAGTVGAAVAWRRARTHRRAWSVVFVVGLVLTLGTAVLGVYVANDGRAQTDGWVDIGPSPGVVEPTAEP